jgi:hypothetical protein
VVAAYFGNNIRFVVTSSFIQVETKNYFFQLRAFVQILNNQTSLFKFNYFDKINFDKYASTSSAGLTFFIREFDISD